MSADHQKYNDLHLLLLIKLFKVSPFLYETLFKRSAEKVADRLKRVFIRKRLLSHLPF